MEHTLQNLIASIDPAKVPVHIAIIMDGNGRWAKERGLSRSQGHIEGVNTVRSSTEFASDMGVGYLTLYAFSTENWNRPKEEVDALMNLIGIAIEQETPGLLANNVRLRLTGDIARLPKLARDRLYKSMDATSHDTGMVLNLCLSYSSRWELTETMRKIAMRAADGSLTPEMITEQTIADNLNTAGMPYPDLLIRTGGEYRISNYLLWQIAYSELYFTPCLWPDFTKECFAEAIIDFQKRERRFGKTSEQIEKALQK